MSALSSAFNSSVTLVLRNNAAVPLCCTLLKHAAVNQHVKHGTENWTQMSKPAQDEADKQEQVFKTGENFGVAKLSEQTVCES
jgi:hypothetical protein